MTWYPHLCATQMHQNWVHIETYRVVVVPTTTGKKALITATKRNHGVDKVTPSIVIIRVVVGTCVGSVSGRGWTHPKGGVPL